MKKKLFLIFGDINTSGYPEQIDKIIEDGFTPHPMWKEDIFINGNVSSKEVLLDGIRGAVRAITEVEFILTIPGWYEKDMYSLHNLALVARLIGIKVLTFTEFKKEIRI